MTELVVHVTHTDPRRDSKILKTMRAVSSVSPNAVWALGFSDTSLWERADSLLDNEAIHIIGSLRAKSEQANSSFVKALERVLSPVWLNVAVLVKGLWLSRGNSVVVVHVHDVSTLPGAAVLALSTRAKLFYDAHELESQRTGITRLESALIRAVERLFWSRIDHFFTVSQGIEDWYSQNLGPKRSTVILNSPVVGSPRSRRVHSSDLKSLLEISPDSSLFVYVGQLSAGRGIRFILDAFSSPRGKDHVLFIGDGPLRDPLEEASRRSARVHLMNPVKHSDLVAYISTADYGLCIIEPVSLSYRHALPNKLFEFAFAGLPVVASNLPDMAALVLGHSLGVSVESSAEGVSEGLKLVKGFQAPDPLTLIALGWESQAEKIRSVYELLGAFETPQ